MNGATRSGSGVTWIVWIVRMTANWRLCARLLFRSCKMTSLQNVAPGRLNLLRKETIQISNEMWAIWNVSLGSFQTSHQKFALCYTSCSHAQSDYLPCKSVTGLIRQEKWDFHHQPIAMYWQMKGCASPRLLFIGLSVPQIFMADHVPGTVPVTGYTLVRPMDKVPCEVSLREANNNKS